MHPGNSAARRANEEALQASREDVWFLKDIVFEGQQRKIITQNYNGCVVGSRDPLHVPFSIRAFRSSKLT